MKKLKILFNSITIILFFTLTVQMNSFKTSAAASEGSGARIIEYGVSGTAKFHMANPVGRSEKLAVEATGSKTITDISFTSNNTSICSITEQRGYWEVSRLKEGIAVITMTCKANGENVKRTMLMSNLSYLPNNETPNGTLKANTTIYIGCSVQEGITSDDTEVRAVVTSPTNVRVLYRCNDFYRVQLISGTFGTSGIDYGHVLKSQVDVPITGLNVKNTITILEKKIVSLGATVTPAITTQRTFLYHSSNEKVVKLTSEKLLEAIGPGTATVTITSVSNPALTRQCRVTVKPLYPVTGITISPKPLEIDDGETGRFEIFFTPANASIKDFEISVSQDDVIQVDPAGRYCGLNPGTATVTVTSTDGGFKDSCEVLVKEVKATGVYLQSKLELGVGGQGKPAWNMIPRTASNKNVTWSSDNPSIAKVDKYGNVTGVKVGKTWIRLVTEDGNFKAACEVNVNTYVQDIQFAKYISEMTLGEKKTITAKLTPANPGRKKLIWSSKKEDVVQVSQGGVVKALKTGIAEVVLYDRYTGAFDFVIINVDANLKKPKLQGKKNGKNLTLSWKKVDRATHYVIYKYNKSKKKFVKLDTVKKTKKSYKITKVTKGERYKVRAYYEPNDEYSKFSKGIKVK